MVFAPARLRPRHTWRSPRPWPRIRRRSRRFRSTRSTRRISCSPDSSHATRKWCSTVILPTCTPRTFSRGGNRSTCLPGGHRTLGFGSGWPTRCLTSAPGPRKATPGRLACSNPATPGSRSIRPESRARRLTTATRPECNASVGRRRPNRTDPSLTRILNRSSARSHWVDPSTRRRSPTPTGRSGWCGRPTRTRRTSTARPVSMCSNSQTTVRI